MSDFRYSIHTTYVIQTWEVGELPIGGSESLSPALGVVLTPMCCVRSGSPHVKARAGWGWGLDLEKEKTSNRGQPAASATYRHWRVGCAVRR